MNVANMNIAMKNEFHRRGYTGEDCVIAILDTVIGDVGKMKNNIIHMDSYRVDNKNNGDHGTFIANQIYGWAPSAKIMSYCAFPNGSGKTDIINTALKSILQEAKNNPDKRYFVNMSLAANLGSNVLTPKYIVMQDLIKQCVVNGISVFVASGNDGTEQLYIYPSRFKDPICVGACAMHGSRAEFSTWHDELDFIDEGVSVIGINQSGLPTMMCGTSVACPNVLGKAVLLSCLLKDRCGRFPTDSELYQEMINCSIDKEEIGYDKKAGYGFIDINRSDGIGKQYDSVELPISFKETVVGLQKYVSAWIKSFQKTVKIMDATIEYTRPLSKNCAPGDDVLYMKKRLTVLQDANGKPYLYKATHGRFLADTDSAVRRYQADHGLKVDGIVGTLTWNSMFDIRDDNVTDPLPGSGRLTLADIPSNISRENAADILAELNSTTQQRQDFVVEALQYAVDVDMLPRYPKAFYIRGGNLYNKDLSLNVMTLPKLKSYFNRSDYTPYYDGGREEMMLEASDESNYTNAGCDCSGLPVGLYRFFRMAASGFDANANTLFKKYCRETKAPKPGDMMWKDGHAGVYVGAGLAVEFIGGAYGAQLTVVVKRIVHNFVSGRNQNFGGWTAYGRPVFFGD